MPDVAGGAGSETFFELGGALRISILGSVGFAIYRNGITERLPESVPVAAADAARDTLGAPVAVAVAGELPAQVGDALLIVARESFVDGIQVVSAIGVEVAIAVAAFTFMTLRNIPPTADVDSATTTPEPGKVPPGNLGLRLTPPSPA